MRRKNVVTTGVMAMVAVMGMANVSNSVASDAGQGERIGHGGSTYQSKVGRAGDCQVKVDVVERIGAGGSTYVSSQSISGGCQAVREERKQVDVIERIGVGGSTYFSRQPAS